MRAQPGCSRESSSMAGQRESQRLLIHPTRMTRVFHVDRIGLSRRSVRLLGLIAGVVGFSHSKKDHGDGEVDEAGDQGGDPFGPSEEIVGLNLLEVQVELLEDLLGLEGDHTGLMLEFTDGVLELRLRYVLQIPFSVPSPVEDLGFGTREDC